jgi:hypothetical protein
VFTAGEASVTRTSIHISVVSRAAIAALVGAALVSAALLIATPLGAAEWPNVRESDTLWPMAPLGGPQWPQVAADSVKTAPASAPATIPSIEPAKIAAAKPTSDDNLSTSASLALPPMQAPPPVAADIFEKRFPSPFVFEGGARYWYSIGSNRFAFTNNIFPYGNPTSTLDWDRMQGHSGEAFARVDHLPSGLFVKGLLGGGVLKGGDMDDLDFIIDQINFSNTTSAINGNNLRYAMIDLGYAFEVPSAGVRYGAFVGYHYWREKMTAYGVLCNPDQFNNAFCPPAGAVLVPFTTPVDIFETTWHALRIGADARFLIDDRWSISGEVAFVPYAWMTNDDSHLLRADLGPVPNIRTQGWRGMGGEAEAFVNYKVLPHFEIGVGVRYWGLFTQAGSVEFGPTFGPDFPLTKFSTERYGVLLQGKATF